MQGKWLWVYTIIRFFYFHIEDIMVWTFYCSCNHPLSKCPLQFGVLFLFYYFWIYLILMVLCANGSKLSTLKNIWFQWNLTANHLRTNRRNHQMTLWIEKKHVLKEYISQTILSEVFMSGCMNVYIIFNETITRYSMNKILFFH